MLLLTFKFLLFSHFEDDQLDKLLTMTPTRSDLLYKCWESEAALQLASRSQCAKNFQTAAELSKDQILSGRSFEKEFGFSEQQHESVHNERLIHEKLTFGGRNPEGSQPLNLSFCNGKSFIDEQSFQGRS